MSSVPRRMRPGNNFNFDSSTTSSNAASIPPTPDGATFRDLLIFEERLKQNAARLQRRKHKYQGILLLLCAAILLLSYHVLLFPKPQHPLVHYAQLVSLVVCGTTVFLFFASGMYAERIVAANRFVPQANRALRPFNMYLNTRRPPAGDSWLSSLPFIKSSGSAAIESAASAGVSSTAVSKSSLFPASPSGTSLAGGGPTTRLVRDAPDPANPTALPPLRRLQIQPIPPSSNPRGEMIFSSKVSLAFREGYERYRNVFERRRKEKLDAADMESRMRWRWRRWLFALRGGAGRAGGADLRPFAGEKGLEAGAGGTPGSGLGTPTGTRRAGEKSSTSGGTASASSSGRTRGASSSSSGQSSGHKKGASRHHPHPHRTRTNSSASIASSTASNSTQSSAHGHGGEASPSSTANASAAAAGDGDSHAASASGSASGSSTKRKSSPRRKHRDAPPAGSSSLRRSSRAPGAGGDVAEEEGEQGDEGVRSETAAAVKAKAATEPDPTKVAAEGDDRADAEATLREPAPATPAAPAGATPAADEEEEREDEPAIHQHHSARTPASASASSSEDEGEEEEAELVDRSLVDLGSASILSTASLRDPGVNEQEDEGESEGQGQGTAEALAVRKEAGLGSASRSASEGVTHGRDGDGEGEGWVEVRRTHSSRRGGGAVGTGTSSASGSAPASAP